MLTRGGSLEEAIAKARLVGAYLKVGHRRRGWISKEKGVHILAFSFIHSFIRSVHTQASLVLGHVLRDADDTAVARSGSLPFR